MDTAVVSQPTPAQNASSFASQVKAWRFYLIFLSLTVGASMGVRADAWRHWGTGAIESEGAEYARIAENLRTGWEYVGISTPGTQLVFPPLFPSLITAASLVTHNDYELAGRLVSFLLGALLPLPMFGVALRLFHWRTAIIAAVIATLYPVFVNLSMTVFSEGPYATLLMSAVYLTLCALDRPSVKRWCLVGGSFSAAYLVRQEAVAPLIIAVLSALIAQDAGLVVRIKRAVAAVIVFLVLASPQVLLLYRATGKLRLEGKSTINYALGSRALAIGANSRADQRSLDRAVGEAANSINDNLERTGVGMRSNADVIRETHVQVKELIRFFGEAVRRNIPNLIWQLREQWLGAPFLPALALLGAVRRPWRRATTPLHMFFLFVPATAVLATFSVVHSIYTRNYFILLPFLVIWGANGLFEVARWTNTSMAAAFRSPSQRVPGALVAGLIVIAMLSYSLKATRALAEFHEGSVESQPVKDAGVWIKQQQIGRVRVMDALDTVAFHADADYVHFPYCSAGTALRFLDSAKVDYLILRPGFASEYNPEYYNDWLISGIPDARAHLVYETPDGYPNRVLVFHWQQPATNRPQNAAAGVRSLSIQRTAPHARTKE